MRWERKQSGAWFIALLVMAASFLWCSEALANNAGSGGGAYGNVGSRCQQIRQQVESSDQDKAYIVEYIVLCTKTVVQEVFQQFINGFYPLVATAITAALTLATTLFGVLLLTGMVEKSSRDTFVALFKLSCVLFFVQPDTVTRIYEMGIDAMDGLTDLVFQFGKGSSGSRCYDNDTLWDRMDCMLDVLIGTVKNGGSGALTGVSRGIIPSSMAYLLSSGVGALIGLIGIYVILAILFAAIKSIHTYLSAIIALSFILVFAPMFVPMIMFKATRTYFDKWQRIATSFVLQPVILFAFLSLMLIALEDMLLENNGSYIKMTCGQQAAQRDKFCMKELTDNKAIVPTGLSGRTMLGLPTETVVKTAKFGMAEGIHRNPKGDATGYKPSRSSGAVPYGIRYEAVDHKKAGGLSGSGDETKHQERAALAAAALALTAFVFVSMLNYIPTLATELSGGMYEVPNLYKSVGQHLPGGEQLQQLSGKFSSQLKERLGLMAGSRG